MDTIKINDKTRATVCIEIGELQIESSQSYGIVEEEQLISLSIAEAKALRDWLVEVLKNE